MLTCSISLLQLQATSNITLFISPGLAVGHFNILEATGSQAVLLTDYPCSLTTFRSKPALEYGTSFFSKETRFFSELPWPSWRLWNLACSFLTGQSCWMYCSEFEDLFDLHLT
jgi:hypothetical protein